jgi:hypothetical protein
MSAIYLSETSRRLRMAVNQTGAFMLQTFILIKKNSDKFHNKKLTV